MATVNVAAMIERVRGLSLSFALIGVAAGLAHFAWWRVYRGSIQRIEDELSGSAPRYDPATYFRPAWQGLVIWYVLGAA